MVTDFTHGRILQVDFQTGSVIKLPITANGSPGLVLEKSTTTLFYCETFTKSIKYTTLQGDNTTYFYTTGIHITQMYLPGCSSMTTGFISLLVSAFLYYNLCILSIPCEAVSGTLKVFFFRVGEISLTRRKA